MKKQLPNLRKRADAPRSFMAIVRLTEKEGIELKEKAQVEQTTVSDILREAVLKELEKK